VTPLVEQLDRRNFPDVSGAPPPRNRIRDRGLVRAPARSEAGLVAPVGVATTVPGLRSDLAAGTVCSSSNPGPSGDSSLRFR
jgi:hypothetical protein